MSAKSKLILSIGALFIFIISAFVSVGYISYKHSSVNSYTDKLKNQAHLISSSVEQKMARYFDLLLSAGSSLQIDILGHYNQEQIVARLQYLENNFEVIKVFFSLADGTTYDTGGFVDDFNAREKNREWFQRAINDETYIITKPYLSTSGKTVFTLSAPVKRSGEIVGVLGIDISLDMLTDYIKTLLENNQLFVARKDGYIIAAKKSELIGENLYEIRPSYNQYRYTSESSHFYQINDGKFFAVNAISRTLGWSVWAWDSKKNIYAASLQNLIINLSISVVLVLASLGIIYSLITRLMYTPIGGEPTDIEAMMKKIAGGDLSQAGSPTGSESGIYAATLTMITNLTSAITKINTATALLSDSSTQLSSSASNVQQSSESQTKQLEQTSIAMNKMTVTVDEVARSAHQASTAVKEANEYSQKGIQVVDEMNQCISGLVEGIKEIVSVNNRLEKETQSIETILEVIHGISEQTNLLALNAAIEAARAGEQGRGFAVVADEVRSLANRTQTSTNKIQEMITRLQNEARQSVDLLHSNLEDAQTTAERSNTANQTLRAIQDSVAVIQDMNNQIATATEQQALVASEINSNVVEISNLAKSTYHASEHNSDQAKELTQIAQSLSQSVEEFKL